MTVRGFGGNALPEWAENLVRSCRRYTFTTQQVYDGRSVVATKTDDGPGPLLVITSSEEEMRTALGLGRASSGRGHPYADKVSGQ